MDIVAKDGPTLVFVEVKTRTSVRFGSAAEAVTRPKQRRMLRLALEYMTRHHLADCPCRFDVVSIHMDGGLAAIDVFQNAFHA